MPPISTMAAGVALDENCMCDSHRVSTLVLNLREGATFRDQSCHKRFLHQLETEKELCLITLFNFSLGQHHRHLSKWHLLCAPLTGDLGLWSCGASEIAPMLPDLLPNSSSVLQWLKLRQFWGFRSLNLSLWAHRHFALAESGLLMLN